MISYNTTGYLQNFTQFHTACDRVSTNKPLSTIAVFEDASRCLRLKEPKRPKRRVLLFSNHHMVVQRDADRGTRTFDLLSHIDVGLTWRRVA